MLSRRLLLAYAALNAVLYSALLPLWEGFDEPFHFAYVQQFGNLRGLPDARSATLSREVETSLLAAPVSSTVQVNVPHTFTYAEFFSWTPEHRTEARRALEEIPPNWRWLDSRAHNYEAHHPPLAYLLLALPERLLAAIPLPPRVLVLRILAALSGALLLYTGASALCAELEVAEPFRSTMLFCLLSSQMTWATIAHVANDWLAVPLAVWTLVLAIRCAARPTMGAVILMSLVLSAGLLTKAYFLVLEPLVFAVCLVRAGWRGLLVHVATVGACAAPWYLRNQQLYGSFTGLPEARSGFGAAKVLAAFPELQWPKVALDSIRSALWTGNNTFRVFSTRTLDCVWILCAAALLLWAFRRHKRAEIVAALYGGCVLLALAYAAALAHLATHGASSTPSPWYSQLIVAPLLALALLGAARRRQAGAFLAAAIALLFGYILAVTYLFRLIPLYAGFEGRGSAGAILALYSRQFGSLREKLAAAALGPPWLIFALVVAVAGLIVVQERLLLRGLVLRRRS